MIKEQIQQLETIIDKEIDGYKNIEKLYADKKELLVHGKASELFDVDAKIQNLYKNISNLSDARKNVTKAMEIPTFSLTDIINKIKDKDEESAKKLESKKEEVKQLAQRIFELEKVNMELLNTACMLQTKLLKSS